MKVRVGNSTIELLRGDITEQAVDAIVNAANSSLMGGGGVDGAIHRVGGPAILEQCQAIVAKRGRLPAGQAVATTGGKLPARWVIHTVGPFWSGGERNEASVLTSAYRSSLELTRTELQAENIRSIAFPSISTGAYRYPLDEAAETALQAVRDWLVEHPTQFEHVRFVLFDEKALAAYERAAKPRPTGSLGDVSADEVD